MGLYHIKKITQYMYIYWNFSDGNFASKNLERIWMVGIKKGKFYRPIRSSNS